MVKRQNSLNAKVGVDVVNESFVLPRSLVS